MATLFSWQLAEAVLSCGTEAAWDGSHFLGLRHGLGDRCREAEGREWGVGKEEGELWGKE